MEELIIIGIVVVFVFLLNLRGRIAKLERLREGGATRDFEARYETPKAVSAKATKPMQTEQTHSEPTHSEPTQTPHSVHLFDWLKEDWMLKLGALLLLVGFGWLTTYAFLHNWIGPVGRIGLGIGAGVAFSLTGWWRIQKYIHQGGIFLVLGSTTILLTMFAAREIYQMFTPISALIIMFLSTVSVALASVKYRSRSLALTSLVLAGIAPLLTDLSSTSDVWLFSYLLVVTIGAIWVVALTAMRELTAAALLLVTFYSLPYFSPFDSSEEVATLLLFAYAFAALFFLTTTVAIVRMKDSVVIPNLVTAAGNGLLLLLWIITAAEREWQSGIMMGWMGVFVIGAFLTFRITKRRMPFYVYSGVGIAMLGAATSVELSGSALTIAYTIESAIVAIIAYAFLRDIKIAERTSLLLVVPTILSFESITSTAWNFSIFHEDFFVVLALGLTLFGLGLFFHQCREKTLSAEPRTLSTLLLIIGSIYFYALLWLSLGVGVANKNTAVMISLVIYTIIGLISYFYGLSKEKNGLRLYGGALVGLVVGRLFLVDIWEMALTGRIITFFLIGALLVSTAFLGKKKSTKPENS